MQLRCAGDEMTLLRIDYQPNTPVPWVGVALLGAAVVALILTGTYYYQLNGQIANWEAKVERTKDKRVQRSAERGGVELAQEVKNANDVLRRLSVPWESLFQAVESSGNQNITLLAIEPDIEKQQVKIGGEAKNFNALMKYITHLQGQVVFGSVNLQNHDVQQQDPDKPVRFSLLAAWKDKS
jgi:Tfp pilus assembly protein PilN